MFILHESSDQVDFTDNFKSNLDKRIELLKHLFNNTKLKRDILYSKILDRLDQQKKTMNKIFKKPDAYFLTSVVKKSIDEQMLNHCTIILQRIQTLFLYRLYLEENALVYKIINSNRVFTNFYYQIDKPTEVTKVKNF